MDPWWNPAAEYQAIDRAHRIGQFKPIRAVRFVVRNTVSPPTAYLLPPAPHPLPADAARLPYLAGGGEDPAAAGQEAARLRGHGGRRRGIALTALRGGPPIPLLVK